jgi:hypothetical protein
MGRTPHFQRGKRSSSLRGATIKQKYSKIAARATNEQEQYLQEYLLFLAGHVVV